MKQYKVTLQNLSVEGSSPTIMHQSGSWERARESFTFWDNRLDEQRERGISSDNLQLVWEITFD